MRGLVGEWLRYVPPLGCLLVLLGTATSDLDLAFFSPMLTLFLFTLFGGHGASQHTLACVVCCFAEVAAFTNDGDGEIT